MTSSRIPAPIGPYNRGKKIECCGKEVILSSGQIGVDPSTSELVGEDAGD